MDKQQAETIIKQALASLKLTLQEHQLIQQALAVLLKP